MKRLIDYHLLAWKNRPRRKSLMLRGARQVGKTHAVRVLGGTFPHFVEVNLEFNKVARSIMAEDLDPHRIIFQLSQLCKTPIIPG